MHNTAGSISAHTMTSLTRVRLTLALLLSIAAGRSTRAVLTYYGYSYSRTDLLFYSPLQPGAEFGADGKMKATAGATAGRHAYPYP